MDNVMNDTKGKQPAVGVISTSAPSVGHWCRRRGHDALPGIRRHIILFLQGTEGHLNVVTRKALCCCNQRPRRLRTVSEIRGGGGGDRSERIVGLIIVFHANAKSSDKMKNDQRRFCLTDLKTKTKRQAVRAYGYVCCHGNIPDVFPYCRLG